MQNFDLDMGYCKVDPITTYICYMNYYEIRKG